MRRSLRALLWAALLLGGPAAVDAQVTLDPELRQRARAGGSTRVIVRLAESAVGARSPAAVAAARRTRIAGAQTALLGRLPAGPERRVRRFERLPLLALHASASDLDRLAAAPGVTSVTLDALRAPTLAVSTLLLQADAAWLASLDGAGHTVAILDTGVDGAHPFLSGKVVAEACFSGGSDCPNGGLTQVGPGAAVPCTYSNRDCKHGTHVAGIAAGRGTSSDGVAREASMIAIQVFSSFTGAAWCGSRPSPCALSYVSDEIAALQHVYSLRDSYTIGAANLSLGGGMYGSPCDVEEAATKLAIDELRAEGIATVIASGNDGYTDALSAPACISTAISVGSTTQGDTVALTSNSASFLSLLAPGASILSSVPGGGFALLGGTSMAAPHVSGAFAILRQFDPTASVSEHLAALQAGGVLVTDSRNGIAKPRIRLFDAMPGAGLLVPALGVAGRMLAGAILAGAAISRARRSTHPRRRIRS